jgi:predicted alpha/beta-fold hydrolase
MFDDLAPCVPPWWAPNGHLQTILGHILPSWGIARSGKFVTIDLADGDQLHGEYFEGSSPFLITIFHGLGGNTYALYMRRSALVAQNLNHSVLLIDHRGCGGGRGRSRGIYHSGKGDDLSEVLSWARKNFPKHRHVALGFSLGANALLVLLTGIRGYVLPDYAIAVNGPINLEGASVTLSRGFNRVYDLKYLADCKKELKFREKIGFIEKGKYKISPFSTLHEFDEIYTSRVSGFPSREKFYAEFSTAKHLEKIKTPTIILTSKDDPFIDYRDYVNARFSGTTVFRLEEFGGHMGYLSKGKTPLGSHRWLDYALDSFFKYFTNND